MTDVELSRREVLRSGVLGSAAVVAGCLGDGSGSTTTAPGTDSAGPISAVSVDGSDLVVELVENHDVSGVNLIGPDGSAFAETKIPVGETTTRIELLDIRPGVGGYEHYEPGLYELVAVGGSGSSKMEVALEPDLRITAVEQYREGERPADYGKLAVSVENAGTGPTWVYDITYDDAPNFAANNELVSGAGVPQLTVPDNLVEAVIGPQNQRQYVGTTTPLQFGQESGASCEDRTTFSVIVGAPIGNPLEARVSVRMRGESRPVGLVDQYTCTEVEVMDLSVGGIDA